VPRILTRLIVTVSFCGMGMAAHAAAPTPVLEVARLCSQHFARVERELGIPKQLVQAIAMSESGRWSDEARAVVPWPWTINAQGQGYYFDTMHEAVTFARRLKLKGVESMDVGCMQVNLKHHPNAFSSLTEAFNPASNVAYGAKFLRSNFDDLNSWPQAIAAYHSRGTARGRNYFTLVRRNWQRALGAPVEYASLSDVSFNGARRDYGLAERNRMFSISVRDGEKFRSLGESETRTQTRSSNQMKVIQVGDAGGAGRSSGKAEVLVVRPTSAAQNDAARIAASVTAAPSAAETPFVRGGQSREPEALLAASANSGAGVKRISSRQKGPNFIFD
jgi:hypothetical protein